MALRDKAFQRVFSKTFVYNVLFEDAELDEAYLGLDEDSTVLSITGAGCGVAGMLAKNVRSIDACDINGHHLTLTALKLESQRQLDSYTEFYDLLGRGWSPDPQRTLTRVAPALPDWMAPYLKKHSRRFRRSLYLKGMTSQMLGLVRKQCDIGADWCAWMSTLTVEERVEQLLHVLAPVQRNPLAVAMMRSPVQLVALGINFQQRDRLVETEQQNMTEFFVSHLTRIMETDLEKNWYFWLAGAGQFNHAHEDAVPPYLRRSRWESARTATTKVNYHHGNLFDKLAEAGPNTWSHYTLCDAVDWMPPEVQRHLFEEIRRTARPGATVLMRSVDADDPVVETKATWLHKQACSEGAHLLDRSRQYRQVNFYTVDA